MISSKKSVDGNTFFLTEKRGKRPKNFLKNGHLEPMEPLIIAIIQKPAYFSCEDFLQNYLEIRLEDYLII